MNKYILKNGNVYYKNEIKKLDIYIEGSYIKEIDEQIEKNCKIIDVSDCLVSLGFYDMHVHLREPGFSHKETIKTGSLSGLYGGYSHLVAMANTLPCMDSMETIEWFEQKVKQDACNHVFTYSAITSDLKGNKIVDIAKNSKHPLVLGFSDDGKGVQDEAVMEKAMQEVKKNNSIIVAHCEDERELKENASVNEGVYSRVHDLVGINNASEYLQVKRDIDLVRKYHTRYHVCHVSCKETVELIRLAKKEGLPVSAEVSPHHLVLSDNQIQKLCTLYKMNPPIRSKEDKKALIEGLKDGTLDVIATDHAPHTKEEKNQSMEKAPFGIIGLQHAFPLVYTELVRTHKVSLLTVLQALTSNPRRILEDMSFLEIGEKANICVFDLESKYEIKEEDFVSKSSNSPFKGMEVYGKLRTMIIDGEIKI